MKKLKIVYCGTPDFAVPSLELLSQHPQVEIISVVTMPDRPAGRGQQLTPPPVAEFAKANKLPLFQTENINKEPEFLEKLKVQEVDLFVVLAFAQFLGSKILALPKMGCFNIHTSLLPKYRGAAPIQYALLNGDSGTGVSIQRMVKEMDAGDVALLDPVAIAPHETGGQLYTRLKFQAALSLNTLLERLIEGKIEFIKQNETEVSFAPTLKKEDGFVDFKSKSVLQIKNQVRALDPWPGTYCFLGKKRLKILGILEAAKDLHLSLAPGKLDIDHGGIFVGCLDGILRLTRVQLEGKAICADTELLNGLKNSKEEIILNP